MVILQENIFTFLIWISAIVLIGIDTGREGVGQFIFTLMFATFIARLTDFGFGAINRKIGGASDNIDRAIVGNFIFHSIVVGGIISAIFYLIILRSPEIYVVGYETKYWGAMMIAVTPLLINHIGGNILIAFEKEKLLTFIKTAIAILFFIYLLYLSYHRALSSKLAISAWVAVLALTGLFYMWFLWSTVGMDISARFHVGFRTIQLSTERFFADITTVLLGVIDLFAIAFLLNIEELSYYAIPLLIISIVWRLPWAIAGLRLIDGLHPVSHEQNEPEHFRLTIDFCFLTLLIGATLSWTVFNYFMTDYFPKSYFISLAMLPGGFGLCCAKLMFGALYRAKNYSLITGVNLVSVATMIILYVRFIPEYGVWAATWIFSAYYFIFGIISLVYFKRKHKIGWIKFLIVQPGDFPKVHNQSVRNALKAH